MVYPIFKRTVLPIAKLFLKEIKGIENIPKKGPFIITSNHESYMDPYLILSVMIRIRNEKIHFLAKKGPIWRVFGCKITVQWTGCVCADEGKEKALQELLSLLEKDKIIAIFIEGIAGIEGLDDRLKRGKTGVVRLALKAKVPILPIGLIGTSAIAAGMNSIPKLKRAKLHIGKPIYLNKFYEKDINKKLLRELTDDVMHVISELTGKPYSD
jgi:1-acyl-sn-glycerol-3-phosphate acyltransferase